MQPPFPTAVTERTLTLETRLCVGLDPRLSRYRDVAHLRQHTLEVLEATAPYAAACKPQVAFYEALGLEGLSLLEEICAGARELGLPLILDAKRGDIGSTAEAYAQAWLAGKHAGAALTVNPFLGFETLQPFVNAARENGGGLFVLVKTSNAGQGDLQGGGISERVAAEVRRLNAEEEGSGYASVGAVVGATHPEDLPRFRAAMPRALLLLPGLGAQGAAAGDLAGAFGPRGTGALASASRGVQYAGGAGEGGLSVLAARDAAKAFRDQLNAVLG